MEKELEKALKKVADRLESLEGSSKTLTEKVATLEESDLTGRLAKFEESEASLMGHLADRVAKLEDSDPAKSDILGDAALLQEKDDKIAQLEGRKISDFPGREQGAFLLETLSRMPAETVAVILATAGKAELLNEGAAQLAQVKTGASELVDDSVLEGKTDKPGYEYLEMLNISIKLKQ